MNTFSTFTAVPRIFDQHTEGTRAMLLHEELAKIRIREALRSAEEQRRAHRLVVAHRWRRVAGWAARRAERSASRHV